MLRRYGYYAESWSPHRYIDNITEPTPSHLAASGDADSPAALIFGLTTLMMRLRFLISTTHRKLRRLVMRALTSQNFALLFHLCVSTRIHNRLHHAPAVPDITWQMTSFDARRVLSSLTRPRSPVKRLHIIMHQGSSRTNLLSDDVKSH